MPAPVAGVVGMSALRRDINRLATETSSPVYAEIKRAGRVAVEPIAARARATVPNVSGDLAGTVRTSGTKTGATVRMGLQRVPYAGWIDFGGVRGDGSERPYLTGGRYLFPAAESLASVAAGLYSAALQRAFDRAPWSNTTSDPGAVHD